MANRLTAPRFLVVGLVATGLAIIGFFVTRGPVSHGGQAAYKLTTFRSPTCGCCGLWIEHMKAAGFQVKDQVTEDMAAVKQQYGVPETLTSCHTTVVGDYVIEGHIPAEDVQRLLTNNPEIAGIAVPGMPIGSPGMESGEYVEPYTVFSFQEDGATAAFAEHS